MRKDIKHEKKCSIYNSQGTGAEMAASSKGPCTLSEMKAVAGSVDSVRGVLAQPGLAVEQLNSAR